MALTKKQLVVFSVAVVALGSFVVLTLQYRSDRINLEKKAATYQAADGQEVANALESSPAKGLIVLDPTLISDKGKTNQVKQIEYYSNDAVLHSSTKPPYYLDSTLVPDGTYSIRSVVTFKDDSVQEQTNTITVSNGANGHGGAGYGNPSTHTGQ